MNKYIEETNSGLVHTYNRFPLVLDHGEGAYLYDRKKATNIWTLRPVTQSIRPGIRKCQEWNHALKSQIDKIIWRTLPTYTIIQPDGEAAEELKRMTGMDRIFFTNSGGEAIEGALKAPRKYAYKKERAV